MPVSKKSLPSGRLAALVVVVVVVVVATAGCDLFAIRCNDDDDCPAEVPFCNAEICQATAGGSRAEGEGEGGEGEDDSCDSDADCGAGLCYDLPSSAAHFEAARVDTCVPGGGGDDVSCAEATNFNGSNTDRPSQGSVIFSVTAVRRAPTDCGPGQSDLEIQVPYLDREGDLNIGTTQLLFVRQGGLSPEFGGGGSISGDGTSGAGFFFLRCIDDADIHIALALGQSGPESNSVCVALGALVP